MTKSTRRVKVKLTEWTHEMPKVFEKHMGLEFEEYFVTICYKMLFSCFNSYVFPEMRKTFDERLCLNVTPVCAEGQAEV